MAVRPRRKGEERSLSQRGGDPFNYLRSQINRVFDDFGANRRCNLITTVDDGTLTIKGEKKYEHEQNERGQYRMERSYGTFERTIGLPAEVDESKAKAEFKKGVLKLTLPKRAGAASRRQKIQVT